MNHLPLIDIGVNLTNKRFHDDFDEVIDRARYSGIIHAIITGTSLDESRKALELVERSPEFLSSTAGVHPHVAKHWNSDMASEIRELLKAKQVVASGECGLDFNRDFSPRAQQERCFAD